MKTSYREPTPHRHHFQDISWLERHHEYHYNLKNSDKNFAHLPVIVNVEELKGAVKNGEGK